MLVNGLPAGVGATMNTEQGSTFVTERVRGFIDVTSLSTAASEATFQKLDNDRNVHDFSSDDKFIKIPCGAKVNFAVIYPLDTESYASIQSLTTSDMQINVGLARSLAVALPADGDDAYSNYGAIDATKNPALFVSNWYLNKNKTSPLFMIVHTMGPVPRIKETVSGMYVKCRLVKANTKNVPLRLGIHIEYIVMRDDIYSRLYSM